MRRWRLLISGRVGAGATSNGVEYHLDAIASCVIGGVSMKGGVGSVFGVVIGVLIMGALQNGLNIMGVSPYWQQICKGLIIIVAVVADTLKKGSDSESIGHAWAGAVRCGRGAEAGLWRR